MQFTRRYSPLCGLTSGQNFFSPLGKKMELLVLFLLILGNYWGSVVTSVTFSSKLSKFGKKSKISKETKTKKNVYLKKSLKI